MISSLTSKLRVVSSSTRDFYLFNTRHYKFILVQVILSRLLGALTLEFFKDLSWSVIKEILEGEAAKFLNEQEHAEKVKNAKKVENI